MTNGENSPAVDELPILFRMLKSKDPVERSVAAKGIRDLAPEMIASALSDENLDPELIDFFARHLGDRLDWARALAENPSLPEDLRVLVHQVAAVPVLDDSPEDGVAGEGEEENGKLSLTQRIQAMGVSEKIKLAMKGDKEVRTILLKDSNRQIYMTVLSNPGIKESEIEMLVKNTATNADILRAVAKNREWSANRNIVKNLVMNPKTPVEVTIRFLPRLNLKDLEFIDKSRNLPMALRTNAKRILLTKKKGR